jgi:hypothetical protein
MTMIQDNLDKSFLDSNEASTKGNMSTTQQDENQQIGRVAKGLQVYGLDPFSMSLDYYQSNKDIPKDYTTNKKENINKTKTIHPLTKKQDVFKDKAKLEDIAPKCPGHQILCRLITVSKKTSANKASVEYVCIFLNYNCHLIIINRGVSSTLALILETSSVNSLCGLR